MPESPEVQALAEFVGGRLSGRAVTAVDLVEFRALKTRTRPLERLVGTSISGAQRYGKHLDISADAQHLVVSFGRHGWARLLEADAQRPVGPPALGVLVFDDGATLEFTDAGGWVSVGLHVVDAPQDVPAVAKLGPDPADPAFTRAQFDAALAGRRKQIKAILQEQESLAGIGNAYSDEILHAAKVSPVAQASALADEALDRVFVATTSVVRDAATARRGIPIDELKAAKVRAMRVHGRAGELCPVCGDEIRDFAFASTTAEYCPTCQTDGVRL